MMLLSWWLPLAVNLVVFGGSAAAAAWVFRRQRAIALSDLQTRTIQARTELTVALQEQLAQRDAEIARLSATLAAIRVALEPRGLRVAVNGTRVYIVDTQASPRMKGLRKDEAEAMASRHDEGFPDDPDGA